MSADLEGSNMVTVDVCICTFRRPALAATIHSLARQIVPAGVAVRLIVADNDVTPTAEPLVRRLAEECPHPILYTHAPAQNISIARNACLDAASGDFLAFIDDDETASPGWLAALLEASDGADAVLGPARAAYEAEAPQWMRSGDFHSTSPVWVNGEIVTGYTCNVLLRRDSPAVAGRRFAVALGRSGGEDTDYFTGLTRAGGQIVYAERAVVDDPVPANRARFSWLMKRRFRMGQTHGRIVIGAASGAARLRHVVAATAKTALCFAMATATVPFATRRNRWALRGTMHAGVVAGLLGLSEITQYGDVEPSQGKTNAA
jgi:succinoglycan biosynthesis protein ExoM